jgi:hypothetical protein
MQLTVGQFHASPLFSANTIGRIVPIELQPLTLVLVTQGPLREIFSLTDISHCALRYRPYSENLTEHSLMLSSDGLDSNVN